MKRIDKGSLIVSCQALKDEPLHSSKVMAKMALAAKMGGASGIRANSPRDIKEIKKEIDLPLIGLWKQEVAGYEVYITPRYADVKAVLKAGADYVAIDSTSRKRPEKLADLYNRIRNEFPDRGIVADIASVEDVKRILPLKPDFISTTMSGYTEATKDKPKPDLELVRELSQLTETPIIAEGNYQNGIQAKKAIDYGAYAVVIGTAITRPQIITEQIMTEMKEG